MLAALWHSATSFVAPCALRPQPLLSGLGLLRLALRFVLSPQLFGTLTFLLAAGYIHTYIHTSDQIDLLELALACISYRQTDRHTHTNMRCNAQTNQFFAPLDLSAKKQDCIVCFHSFSLTYSAAQSSFRLRLHCAFLHDDKRQNFLGKVLRCGTGHNHVPSP